MGEEKVRAMRTGVAEGHGRRIHREGKGEVAPLPLASSDSGDQQQLGTGGVAVTQGGGVGRPKQGGGTCAPDRWEKWRGGIG